MMARGLLLFFATAIGVLATLTVFKAPSLTAWKLAILVGEFGHWLWVVVGALAVAASFAAPAGSWWRWAIWSACAIAFCLLAKPTVQAFQLARALPQRLGAEFGSVQLTSEPLSLKRLFIAEDAGAPVRRETKVFVQRPGEASLSLDFYYTAGDRAAPCVLVIHGGGWDGGDRGEFEAFNEHLARKGFAVAAMDYRLAPQFKWPSQRQDAEAALHYLQAHSSELGIDPSRFVVFGRSAGGQIAEALAFENPDPAIRGVVAFYAPADLYFAWHYTKEDDLLNSFLLMRQYLDGSPEEVPEAFESSSPYRQVKPGAVPALLLHGQLDALVWHRQSERLTARLRETRNPVLFLDLPWATHACDYNPRGPTGQLSAFAVEWFLRSVFGPDR